jgi:hypothetical protein
VTHNGRQARVRALAPGTPVALVREPNNPYDPRAVAVHTLAGASLGYVPRGMTAPFNDGPPLEATVLAAGVFRPRGNGQELAWATLRVRAR